MKASKLNAYILRTTLSLFAILSISNPAHSQSVSVGFAEAFAAMEAPAPPVYPEDGAVDISKLDQNKFMPRHLGQGAASYYGRRFDGKLTANGETFDMNALTAAHRTLPFGSVVRVTNLGNGRSVTVRINDRGPFVGDRVIDLSRAAAKRIGLIRPGHAVVALELVEN